MGDLGVLKAHSPLGILFYNSQEESEEKKQKRMEKEIRNMRNKIRHLKEKQDNMKRERMAYKMALKNQQGALKSVFLFGVTAILLKYYAWNRF